ncbi:hypothetical protein K437DRAFT_259183 [Tilletiaria anomala UBC 951]|uniref:Uncharacterized protein n=1 Tax=Tilletiaria anomala (strain ATCC 24038 / CBS 436.72 / UBC 951) TaxID=1037660 RepID=A0A066VC63_TILAU|nr:uncharacterized protein K437DRAFT_259183 [Tilletiaria anomala UBC 951]KDN39076.1 hypothetical protein K437DRAFT_259183 [Tilletiaria anomala UBC 951]
MRLTAIFASLLLVSTSVLAVPAELQIRADPPKGLIQNVGQLVAAIEKGAGITGLRGKIDETFGGNICKLENAVGLTKVEKAVGLTDDKIPDGILEKVLHLVKALDDAVGGSALEGKLNKALHGGPAAVQKVLGVAYLRSVLGIE